MKLWLVRHARPLIDAGICYGHLDVPAEAAETRALALTLAHELPMGCALITSPLSRCRELGEALAAGRADLSYNVDPRLAEMHFGHWEGQPWAAIEPRALRAWTDDFAGYRTGDVGESTHELMQRVASAWDDLTNLHTERADVVWITHAGVMRAVQLIAAGTRQPPLAADWPTDAPGYGQWRTLDIMNS
ncbi:MAG: histidine phosphatase family protein [Pseudomonadota bacterium]